MSVIKIGVSIGLATLVGLVATAIYPWAYLPPIFAVSVGLIFACNFSNPERPWVGPLCIAYFGSTFFSWTLPSRPFEPGSWHAEAFQVALGLLAVSALTELALKAKSADRRPLPWLLLVYALGVAVSYLSSSAGGSQTMIDWFIAHGCSDQQAHLFTLIFRKTVHFTHYGVLGIAGSFAARSIGCERPRCAAIGLGVVFCTAAFDELRQTTQPGRTGSAYDVMLDMAGALVFISLALFVFKRKTGSYTIKQ